MSLPALSHILRIGYPTLTESATAIHPNRHQHRLHQSTVFVVVVGTTSEPEGQTKEGKHAGEQQQFGHGVEFVG